jgi:AcrR family transcriptional regulator
MSHMRRCDVYYVEIGVPSTSNMRGCVAYATEKGKLMRNSEARGDLRVRRTRMALQKAMIELTVEQGFAALTVGDICERAMVNRATFYRHYQDKFDLLERFMRGVYELTYLAEQAPSQRRSAAADAEQSLEGLVKMLEHVREFAGFYRVMLGPKGELGFAHRMRQYIEQRLRAHLSDARSRDARLLPPDLNLSYASYAGIGVILWWVEHTEQYTPAQVAAWLNQLTAASLSLSLQAPEAS